MIQFQLNFMFHRTNYEVGALASVTITDNRIVEGQSTFVEMATLTSDFVFVNASISGHTCTVTIRRASGSGMVAPMGTAILTGPCAISKIFL